MDNEIISLSIYYFHPVHIYLLYFFTK